MRNCGRAICSADERPLPLVFSLPSPTNNALAVAAGIRSGRCVTGQATPPRVVSRSMIRWHYGTWAVGRRGGGGTGSIRMSKPFTYVHLGPAPLRTYFSFSFH